MGTNPPQIGLYIIDPGETLAEIVDLQAVIQKCAKIRQVEVCEVISDIWAEQSLQTVQETVTENRIDRLVWVGTFTAQQKKTIQNVLLEVGVNPYLHEWCDLQLQTIALGKGTEKTLLGKTLTVIEMALARAKQLQPLVPIKLPASDSVVVVGAGIAGLHAAASFIERGKRVHLVEKQSGVGGKVALLSRFYPLLCNPQCGIEYVLKTLRNSDKLTLHTLSKPLAVEGNAGNFSVTIQSQPRYVDTDRCNGCGLCSNVCPVELPIFLDNIQDEPPFQEAKGIGGLIKETRRAIHASVPFSFPESFVVERASCPEGCCKCEDACPTKAIDLSEQLPAEQNITAGAVLATTGWDPYPLSRLNNYHGYGQHANVIGNLEMEQLLSQISKGSDIPLFPSEGDGNRVGFIQCSGSRNTKHLSYCSSVCCSATIKQIKQLKTLRPDAKCTVFYQDMRCNGFEEELYRELRSTSDVLFVRGFPKVEASNPPEGTKLTLVCEDTFSGRPITTELDLLVLAGGMQPSKAGVEFAELSGLPLNDHNFFEGHYQCYPEESQRTGILTGGCARGPMNASQSIESAGRAAMKALKFLEGTISIEPTYPVVNQLKCDQCKRCVEECPFDCYRLNDKGFPEPDLSKCRQCGNCMGICPVSAISINHLTLKQLAVQIEILENSFLDYEEPIILAFLCENDALVAARSAMDKGLNVPMNVIHIGVPCAGAVNNALIADALSIGIDGVLIGGCKDGQCHYINGNQLVNKRSGDLADKLKTMRVEPERVQSLSLEIHEAERYVTILEDYIQSLKAMGPSPFKL